MWKFQGLSAVLAVTASLHPCWAAETITSTSVVTSRTTESSQTETPSWTKSIGVSYFTFFDGPGLAPGMQLYTPNVLGKPNDDGLRLNNYISAKYRVSSTLAIDLQMRVQLLFNNAKSVDDFRSMRWQSPRIGISGRLLSGEDWSITGAANTDFPYFFPSPLGGGVAATYRTTVFNPGLFAKFNYSPKSTPWSVSGLLMPRFFVYANRGAAEPQLSRAGFSPELKNEFIFDIAPTFNYAVTRSIGVRLGTEFIYSKLILSDWNPFHATLNASDITSKAWRLAPIPIQLGVTHELSDWMNVSVFVQGFPIATQRVNRDGSSANFLQTASVGMWISGTVI